MNSIYSKRNPLRFYFVIIFIFFICIVVATALIFLNIYMKKHDPNNIKVVFLPFASLAFYSMGFYTIYKYYKNAPNVVVNDEMIIVNKEKFNWTELKHISLTGKQPFKYPGAEPMEAMALKFNNKRDVILFDNMYSNLWEIKCFIQKFVLKKEDKTKNDSFEELHKIAIDDTLETFKGIQLLTMRGIMLWGMLLFLLYITISENKPVTYSGNIAFTSFGIFWFWFNSWMMYYFKISDHYLFVKNHNFIWINKKYRISDIKEITFETMGKMPNCLRVISKDFKSKLYPAGTLNDKQWMAIKDKLEQHGIIVRNECV